MVSTNFHFFKFIKIRDSQQKEKKEKWKEKKEEYRNNDKKMKQITIFLYPQYLIYKIIKKSK